jgi:hypothetical protein
VNHQQISTALTRLAALPYTLIGVREVMAALGTSHRSLVHYHERQEHITRIGNNQYDKASVMAYLERMQNAEWPRRTAKRNKARCPRNGSRVTSLPDWANLSARQLRNHKKRAENQSQRVPYLGNQKADEMIDALAAALDRRGIWSYRNNKELWTVINGRVVIVYSLPDGGMIIAQERK